MIDLEQLTRTAAGGAPTDPVVVTRRWLAQAARELGAGRTRPSSLVPAIDFDAEYRKELRTDLAVPPEMKALPVSGATA